jgi:tetratricopeptide (TPR) repeat protein
MGDELRGDFGDVLFVLGVCPNDELTHLVLRLRVVVTADSVTSLSGCKSEWSAALTYRKPVIQLRVEGAVEAPYRLKDGQYISFADFNAATERLCSHLRWLDSPEGILNELERRLRHARHDSRRVIDAAQTARVDREISELEEKIATQRRVVTDPLAAVNYADTRIKQQINRERHTVVRPIEKAQQVINAPPGVVPRYFQNRDFEALRLNAFLQDDSKRLAGVVGRSGAGKTTVVCRLLGQLEHSASPKAPAVPLIDGVVYMTTKGTRRLNAANLFADLARLLPETRREAQERVLRNPLASISSKFDALLAEFTTRRVVVLLDNFEDVLDAKTRKVTDDDLRGAILAMLDAPPHAIKIIITSRVMAADVSVVQPGLQEWIFLDDGLESPYAENVLRGMDEDGTLGLRDADANLLKAVQVRTRGFPRALEAIVGILRADRDTTLPDIVHDTSRLLPEGVLDALIGEAYSRLDVDAKQVMQTLAAISRPVSATAVDYILKPFIAGVDSAPILRRLVNMTLVRREADRRYYLHPSDRAYALSRLPEGTPEDGEADTRPFTRYGLLYRAADYFRLAQPPRDRLTRLEHLESHISEFELRLSAQDYDTAASVVLAIDFDCLYAWGEFRLMADMHERVCAHIRDPGLRQDSFGNLGTACRILGRIPEAVGFYERALATARMLNDSAGEAVWLGNMANCHQDLGDTARAIETHERALRIKMSLRDRWGQRMNLTSLGTCYQDLDDPVRGLKLHRQALALAHEAGDRHAEALIMSNIADALTDTGDLAGRGHRQPPGRQLLA